jgi:pentatricopeptide repeat protein
VLEYLESRGFALDSYYHIAIDVLGKCRRFKEAVDLFRSDRCPKTTFTYGIMMQTYNRAGNVNAAEELFKEMKEAGISVESRTYNILINHYCKQPGGFDKAVVSLTRANFVEGLILDFAAFLNSLDRLHSQC